MKDDITVPIYSLSNSIVRYINNELRQYHLTFQQLSFLIFLKQQEKPINVKEIGVYFGISHPTTVGLISRMVKQNFLVISVLKTDRRQTIVSISSYGENVLNQTRDIVDEINQKFLTVIKKEDYEYFLKTIQDLEDVFKV